MHVSQRLRRTAFDLTSTRCRSTTMHYRPPSPRTNVHGSSIPTSSEAQRAAQLETEIQPAPLSSRPRSNLRRSARGRDPLGARRPTHIVPSPCRARRACKRAARRPRVGLHHRSISKDLLHRAARRPRVGLHHRSTRPTEAHRRVCSIEAHRSTSKHIEGSAPSKLHRSTRLTCLKWQRGTLVPL